MKAFYENRADGLYIEGRLFAGKNAAMTCIYSLRLHGVKYDIQSNLNHDPEVVQAVRDFWNRIKGYSFGVYAKDSPEKLFEETVLVYMTLARFGMLPPIINCERNEAGYKVIC